VEMVFDACIVGVPRFSWRAPFICVLWECGAVDDGWCMLLGDKRVVVVCALRSAVAVLHRLWPELVVAWPYM
jgi:hypothetical protein